jgi:SAM-dependent methyltransferase
MPLKTWSDYYKARGNKPRHELTSALLYVTTGNNALDLGCGAFAETKYMLEKGFSVVAVDPEIGLGLLANEIQSENFIFECLPIQNFSFPEEQFDFVCANYSLPFVPKRKLPQIFASIYRSMKPGGIFTFQLFGKKDGRNTWWRRSISFQNKEEIIRLLNVFQIVSISETQMPSKLVGGKENYSHIFRLIVKK